ncbi:protein-disulfide isomerase [Bacillus mesophilus]|uniref:DsbA family protein n=1 Tax=Bacillus mesophilus TaxID=1808955 RepID=A0A6M0Q3W2_9BACI|nr:DsbA family protein [Bacillus mesophilus]MBM7660042.1 protein-disulfide isomerase [Bacillus mesophilus]NEY70902.1 DsbA family protein [Bacillus mesophilus]
MAKRQKAKLPPIAMALVITLFSFILIAVLVVVSNMKEDTSNEIQFDQQPSIEGQPILGDENAPVTVVEFGDFKCPACKAWGDTVFHDLVSEYVDTGKVKFVYVNVLFHGKESQLGSLAAETVLQQNPDAYWEFHKKLYEAQPSSANHDSLWLTKEKVVEIAGSIPAIDLDQFKSELEKLTEIEELNKDSKLVEEFKVSLTPTIMVNDVQLEDPFDYEKIKSLIEEELEGQ